MMFREVTVAGVLAGCLSIDRQIQNQEHFETVLSIESTVKKRAKDHPTQTHVPLTRLTILY